ncbi:MAG: hypothetical protein ABI560_11645, partial [Myxococcales bacterium]
VVAGAQVPLPLHRRTFVLVVPLQEVAPPQVVVAGLLPVSVHTMTPVAHEVVPVLQTLAGSQVPSVHGPQTPVWQNRALPQLAPSAARLQAPEPLQVPVKQAAVVQVASVAAAGLLLQVPAPLRLQAWQVPQLAVEQQTPLTQLPPAHSEPAVHARPSGLVV